MTYIGFTTRCPHKAGVSINEAIELYRPLGATAIELAFDSPDKLYGFEPSPETLGEIGRHGFISIHAPWKGVRYNPGSGADGVIERLRHLCEQIQVGGIVLHPDTIDDFAYLEKPGLPFLLENVDRRKGFGTRPEHFRRLAEDFGFGFVFDTQHAYEIDPTMYLAGELVSVMGSRLNLMHVSGGAESEGHVPVYAADNRDAIIQALESGISVPKILEGALLKDITEAASRELDFVRGYER